MFRRGWAAWAAVVGPLLVASCGSDAATGGDAAADTQADASSVQDTAAQADSAADTAAAPTPPAPPAYSGTCPNFAAGTLKIQAGGFNRTAKLYLPSDPQGAGLLMLWHGLGDTAGNFANIMQAATVAETYHVAVVVPLSCGESGQNGCASLATEWSYTVKQEERDGALFDALIACADQGLGLDRRRVYTAGFSAGALWSTWLTMHRSEYLAASAIFSGGVNNIVPWSAPGRPVPVVDSSGGVNDKFMNGLVDFQQSIADLNTKLRETGDFVVHCQHQSGHTITAPIVKFAFGFLNDHLWGAELPYAGGLPATAPSNCEIVP
ncbi:MAG: hypothetical protein HY902_11035 [Deltaproteobacteria bacterium]|nr:hypothetical protein [Deltaproteobacteria bacterium]